MLIFDIETRPLSIDELKKVLPPFDPASNGQPPGEFDPSSVKYGNIKDPDKRAEKLEAARQKHAEAVDAFARKAEGAESRHWQDAYDRAALSAETGTVCAIGYQNDAGTIAIDVDLEIPEEQILRRFWSKIASCQRSQPQRRVIGFNSNQFDLPFLIRRSWYTGVEVPGNLFTPTRFLVPMFVDLMQVWQCGDRRNFVKLDTVCRACGVAGKPDDCTGAMFHAFLSDPETREAAIEYLRGDLRMTAALAERLGVM